MSLLIKKEKYTSALTLLKAAVALPSFHFDESTKAKLLQMEIIAKLKLELLKDPIGESIRHPDNDAFYSNTYANGGVRFDEQDADDLPPLTEEEVDIIVDSILGSQAAPPVISSIFMDLQKRSDLDKLNSVGHNIMWALCQSAIMRANLNENADEYIFTPLEYLIRRGCRAEQRFGIAEQTHSGLSLQINPGRTPLQMLALSGATRCADYLISEGAQMESYDIDGWTPLLVACATNGISLESHDNSDMVSMLIKHGANVNHANINGLTPLMAAAYSMDFKSLKLLINHGAQLKRHSVNGFSPLMWALLGTSLIFRNDNSNNEGSYHDHFPSASSIAGSVQSAFTGYLSNQTTITAHHSYHSESTESKNREEIDRKKRQQCVSELLRIAKKSRDVKLLSSMEQDIKCFKIAKLLVYLRHVYNNVVQQYINHGESGNEVEENSSLASASLATQTMPEDLFQNINKILSNLILGSAGQNIQSDSIEGDKDTILTEIDHDYDDDNDTRGVARGVSSVAGEKIGVTDEEESMLSECKDTEWVEKVDHKTDTLEPSFPMDVDSLQALIDGVPSNDAVADNYDSNDEDGNSNRGKNTMNSPSHASIHSDNTSQFELMDFRRGLVQSIEDSLPAIVYKRWFPVNTGHEIDPSQALASASHEDRMKLYTLITLCHGETSDGPLLVLRRVSQNRQVLLEGDVNIEKVKREYHKLNVVWVSSIVEDLEQLVFTPLKSSCKQTLFMSI